jgi:hypothetical protein
VSGAIEQPGIFAKRTHCDPISGWKSNILKAFRAWSWSVNLIEFGSFGVYQKSLRVGDHRANVAVVKSATVRTHASQVVPAFLLNYD